MSETKSGRVKKRVDHRIKLLLEESIELNHRTLLVVIGKHGKAQIINLHWLLSRAQTASKSPYASTGKPNVLWCYKDDLAFSPFGFFNHTKQVEKIKKEIKRGLRRPNLDDPFEAFILGTDIRYVRYRESERILGQTFEFLVIQDFEAITPNLLARTVETVRGGGVIVILLETVGSLKQLYAMSMVRWICLCFIFLFPIISKFTLSLADCRNCLILDDEFNVLPITSAARRLVADPKDQFQKSNAFTTQEISQAKERESLNEFKKKMRDSRPIGNLINCCKTSDQAKSVLEFSAAIMDKTLSSTVVLTAARGRGKSAALGLAVAGAIAVDYANIFVTSPNPENLRTFFEMLLKGFDSLELKEHTDYELIQSTNPDFHRAIVRVNVFRKHRQTVQYIQPQVWDHFSIFISESTQDISSIQLSFDAVKLSQCELLVIDEAAAIPLYLVKELIGPYLVFLSSTVNGYEGTGRSLSLKLVQQLRKQALQSNMKNTSQGNTNSTNISSNNARKLRELTLREPIRYGEFDCVETWLNDLLCLNCCTGLGLEDELEQQQLAQLNRVGVNTSITSALSLKLSYIPDPNQCELYCVNRDTLFSYNKVSEYFLQKLMSLYVSSHYKNQPNDLQLMSDAPAHELFVLIPPRNQERKHKLSSGMQPDSIDLQIPDILAVVQICFEGNLTKSLIHKTLGQGKRLDGDLIPWMMSQQFQDDDFGRLSGARVVRIAVHPHVQNKGYGSKALEQLAHYFQGDLVDIDHVEENAASLKVESSGQPAKKKRKINDGTAQESNNGIEEETDNNDKKKERKNKKKAMKAI
ncbi:hypothetical protein RFI_09460 [Reticulomyxa filosa]|uniref:18S rRNA cytosine acetyltransferase n=1 Tax=Reticulomyxa filosa TaxID=46433 RepID=X6NN21_RETFI|nr:hypothetical protein RFI_09460 [Reticulomyxa filosa]|eukprot:ETO27670.1 hypothetical protein RFI_09460 [Reticulomyxa filosa]